MQTQPFILVNPTDLSSLQQATTASTMVGRNPSFINAAAAMGSVIPTPSGGYIVIPPGTTFPTPLMNLAGVNGSQQQGKLIFEFLCIILLSSFLSPISISISLPLFLLFFFSLVPLNTHDTPVFSCTFLDYTFHLHISVVLPHSKHCITELRLRVGLTCFMDAHSALPSAMATTSTTQTAQQPASLSATQPPTAVSQSTATITTVNPLKRSSQGRIPNSSDQNDVMNMTPASVEDHFAKALGEKWSQLQNNGLQSQTVTTAHRL